MEMQGYALMEYKAREEAETAIEELDGSTFLDKEIRVTWAFVKPPRGTRRGGPQR